MRQKIDHKEGNDNAPPRYSAPDAEFKSALSYHANPYCCHCRGTGYIGAFKATARGRCFQCLPDDRWTPLLGEFVATGIDDRTGVAVCEIRKIWDQATSRMIYFVVRPELPPTTDTALLLTEDEAFAYASKKYKC